MHNVCSVKHKNLQKEIKKNKSAFNFPQSHGNRYSVPNSNGVFEFIKGKGKIRGGIHIFFLDLVPCCHISTYSTFPMLSRECWTE